MKKIFSFLLSVPFLFILVVPALETNINEDGNNVNHDASIESVVFVPNEGIAIKVNEVDDSECLSESELDILQWTEIGTIVV